MCATDGSITGGNSRLANPSMTSFRSSKHMVCGMKHTSCTAPPAVILPMPTWFALNWKLSSVINIQWQCVSPQIKAPLETGAKLITGVLEDVPGHTEAHFSLLIVPGGHYGSFLQVTACLSGQKHCSMVCSYSHFCLITLCWLLANAFRATAVTKD